MPFDIESILYFLFYFFCIAVIVYLVWCRSVKKNAEKLADQMNHDFQKKLESVAQKNASEKESLLRSKEEVSAEMRKLKETRLLVKNLLEEKSQTYPWLSSLIAEYFETFDQKLAQNLLNKTRPAPRAAEDVSRLGREKKELVERLKLTEHQLLVYESHFPWLLDFKELTPSEITEIVEATSVGDATEKELLRRWLSDDEYAALSDVEKYQLALDRYKQYRKNPWEAGIAYERFIGYQYEIAGYAVQYNGATERLEDMGRDLIATLGNSVVIIQCKRYRKESFVRENTVFQLHGTSVLYQIKNPGVKVIPAIYSSAPLSDMAAKCAKHLGIVVRDRIPLEDYPMIKCNISSSGERIYHLPFDQQYDRVRIIPDRGEKYVDTVAEAEAAGFRRAWRWHGTSG